MNLRKRYDVNAHSEGAEHFPPWLLPGTDEYRERCRAEEIRGKWFLGIVLALSPAMLMFISIVIEGSEAVYHNLHSELSKGFFQVYMTLSAFIVFLMVGASMENKKREKRDQDAWRRAEWAYERELKVKARQEEIDMQHQFYYSK